MKIKYEIPLYVHLFSKIENHLKLNTTFFHNDFEVFLELIGGETVHGDSFSADLPYHRQINKMGIFVSEKDESKTILKSLVEDSSKHLRLIEILKEISNRIIRNLRNFGLVTNSNEIYDLDNDVRFYLLNWNVQISVDDIKWESLLIKTDGILSQLAMLRIPDYGIKRELLLAGYWPDIEEAIQDDLEPPPEQEFLANTYEHLSKNNFRLALVESIISLEIVLSQFLEAYLKLNFNFPNRRVKKFLNPDLGLTSRISGLLDLTLEKDEIAKIDINNILKAIEWRNHIIHKTGHLPVNLEGKIIKTKIGNVIELTYLLSEKRDKINVSPELQGISNDIAEKHSITSPTIYILKRHRILVEFFFIFSKDIPDEEIILSIVSDLKEIFSSRDRRFNPDNHLFVRFRVLRDVYIRWHNNKLEYIK